MSTFDNLVAILTAWTRRPAAVNEIRGPYDNADIDGLLNVNYAVIEKDFYDLAKAITTSNNKSKSGFVVIGVTNDYYTGEIPTPWLEPER